ncbi:MAG: undecaprenyl diphosphate synthase family protein [Bacteroidia bacterium]
MLSLWTAMADGPKSRGHTVVGHRSAIKAVRYVTEGCAELGVKVPTLYAFSTENWNRPTVEVNAIISVDTLAGELPTLQKNRIRLNAIGNLGQLPNRCEKAGCAK